MTAKYFKDPWGCGDLEDDEEICNYTGEQCFGNPMFCEECEAMLGE